jgi:hypothetical protein
MDTRQDQETPLAKWKRRLAAEAPKPVWDEWDTEIQAAVREYNRHLSNATGYIPLDWQLVKAMTWVETGAWAAEWKSRPMQIGVRGDPGLESLISGKEGGELILPPECRQRMNAASIRSDPALNIRAGIGYLLMRLANFKYRSVPDRDTRIYEVIVASGDSLERIAKTQKTTVDTLREMNPGTHTLHAGHKLKYRKAAIQRVITGWGFVNTGSIARNYNGGGDSSYEAKLDFALELIRKKSKE